jgi:hypothetical protein
MPDQRGCTGKPLCQPSRLPHEYRPGIRPKDATYKEARTPRSRGRSVVVLYNEGTHLSVNKDAPSPREAQAVGRIACAISRRTSSSVRASLNSDRHRCGGLGWASLRIRSVPQVRRLSMNALVEQSDFGEAGAFVPLRSHRMRAGHHAAPRSAAQLDSLPSNSLGAGSAGDAQILLDVGHHRVC